MPPIELLYNPPLQPQTQPPPSPPPPQLLNLFPLLPSTCMSNWDDPNLLQKTQEILATNSICSDLNLNLRPHPSSMLYQLLHPNETPRMATLLPPLENPTIIPLTMESERVDVGQFKNRLMLFHIQKGVVRLQLEIKYDQDAWKTKQIRCMLTPLDLLNVNGMDMRHSWKDWDKFYLPPNPTIIDSPTVLVQRPLPNLNMKIVLWNIRRGNGDEFIPHALEIISKHKPTIFIFLETKADDLRGDKSNIAWGGIWLFWQSSVDIVLFNDGNADFFDALFHFSPDHPEVLLTGLHAPSSRIPRSHFWKGMQENLPPPATPWLVMGDMNEVTNQTEKWEGAPFVMLSVLILISLWTVLGCWTLVSKVINLLGRMLVKIGLLLIRHGWSPFLRLKLILIIVPSWLPFLMKKLHMLIFLFVVKMFGCLILSLRREESGAKRQVSIGANMEIIIIIYNTKYFHTIAKIKQNRGKILTLQDSSGNWISDSASLKILATNHFKDIFSTAHWKHSLYPLFSPTAILTNDHAAKGSIQNVTTFGKYLGVNISPNKLKKSDYFGLLDKTLNKIRGWQPKLLNMTGRCTLIKSVLSSYPLYTMQTNVLPVSVISMLEKNCRKFLWNKVNNSRFLSRTSWSRVCLPLGKGGWE
ncbi:hypothetical protein RDABS01_029286 [Bienertia sinuspersici]